MFRDWGGEVDILHCRLLSESEATWLLAQSPYELSKLKQTDFTVEVVTRFEPNVWDQPAEVSISNLLVLKAASFCG